MSNLQNFGDKSPIDGSIQQRIHDKMINEIHWEMNRLNLPQVFHEATENKNRCIYCHKELTPGINKTRDHIVARSKIRDAFNSDTRHRINTSFIVPACSKCNQMKQDLSLDQFYTKVMNLMCECRIIILSSIKKLLK